MAKTYDGNKCADAEHDYLPPVFASIRARTGWRTEGEVGSFLSVCRKCGDTVERTLDITMRSKRVMP